MLDDVGCNVSYIGILFIHFWLRKNETITDTIKMLCGYSTGQSLFVVRSKVLFQKNPITKRQID